MLAPDKQQQTRTVRNSHFEASFRGDDGVGSCCNRVRRRILSLEGTFLGHRVNLDRAEHGAA